ncbi:hypothetical protein C8Q79DRAFT_998087 [Trametes meyenii]|nr:hypothetical protein C8Q79DRAFT_998087 [Trametes meyenii]
MALVVPPPPVEPLRRSPRISVRRQSPSIVSSRNGIATPPALVDPSPSASTLRTRTRRDSYKSRSRVSGSAPSRLRPKPFSGPPLPIRAGNKRKRSPTSSDQGDRSRYELVPATPAPVSDSQTPRQLRYAKRQRLFQPRLSSAARAVVPTRPVTQQLPPRHAQGLENKPLVLPSGPQENDTTASPIPEASSDPDAPVFTPLDRRVRPLVRNRGPDTTDPTLWKTLCQERVQYLKTVYNDLFRAVVHAETVAAQQAHAVANATAGPAPQLTVAATGTAVPDVQADENATPGSATTTTPTQFELYTPPQPQPGNVDADGDVDMDADSSSDDDGDEEDEEGEDEDSTAYEQVMILDTPAASRLPRLPRLSAIRVSGLECHLPSTRDGAMFIGRGTPADRQRLADWAAPAPPLPPRASTPASWTPEPLFFTQDMVPPPISPSVHASNAMPGLDFGTTPSGLGGMDLDKGALSWLDPTLRTGSLSPSPSPTPAPYIPAFVSSLNNGGPPPFGTTSASPMAFGALPIIDPTPVSPTGCTIHRTFLECLQSPICAGPALAAAFFPPLTPSPSPSPSPTPPGPFSAPTLPSSSGIVPAASFAPAFAAPPPAVFPNQELAQFVRSHLVSGSVTLGHALG